MKSEFTILFSRKVERLADRLKAAVDYLLDELLPNMFRLYLFVLCVIGLAQAIFK